jgi:hypothetical protein
VLWHVIMLVHRFASRLGFRISPELVEAASDSRVHSALANKVGRHGPLIPRHVVFFQPPVWYTQLLLFTFSE